MIARKHSFTLSSKESVYAIEKEGINAIHIFKRYASL